MFSKNKKGNQGNQGLYWEEWEKNASVIIKLFLASNDIVTIAVDLEYNG